MKRTCLAFPIRLLTAGVAVVLSLSTPKISFGQYAPLSWAKVVAGRNSSGHNLDDATEGVSADAAGDVFTTGNFAGLFDFGGGVDTSAGDADIFIVKYDGDDGSHLWSKRIGGPGSDSGYDIEADVNGDVIVTGQFTGSVNFGGGSLSSAGQNDVFVAKYSGSDGTHIWSKRFGGSGTDSGRRLALDASGNAFLMAQFDGLFLAKLDGYDGSVAWSDTFVGASGYDLARDSSGKLLVTGSFSSSVNFGGGSISSNGGSDIFVAKFDGSNGSHVWSKHFGSTNNDIGWGIAADDADNIVITGEFKGTMNLGGSSLVATGDGTNTDIYLGRLTPAGTHRWSRSFGQGLTSINEERGKRVATDGATIVMAGEFSKTVDFGGGPLTASEVDSNGEADMVVAAFDTTGSHLWSMNVGGRFNCGGGNHSDGWQDPEDLMFDGDGALLIAGALDGSPTDFGAGLVGLGFDCGDNPVRDNGFVAKYFPPTASLADANLLVCPQGDLESVAATLNFDDRTSIGTVPDSSIVLGGPLGTVNLFGAEPPTASGDATPGNGYTATITDGHIGGCSGGATVPFFVRVIGSTGRLSVVARATVMSPDFDGDGTVSNTSDLATFQATYSKCPGQSGYNACANFVESGTPGCVSLADFALFVSHVGHAAAGSPKFVLPIQETSVGTSVAFGQIEGSSNRFVVTLEQAHSVRALALEISLGNSWQLDGWSTDHKTFSGDVISVMRDGSLWLYVITPGGESVSGDGIELGEITLRASAALGEATPSDFRIRSGHVITTTGIFAAEPGPLASPGDGSSHIAAVRNELIGNVPNPFNPSTVISFSVASGTKGALKIYSATGALVKTLVAGPVTSGNHSIEWDGRDDRGQAVVSGVYFCKLQLGSFVDKKKLVLLK